MIPPNKYSEAQFRRYESLLLEATNNWPNTTRFNLNGVAAITLASGLRNARLSLLLYKWPSSIDLTKFSDPEICIRDCGDHVLFTPRQKPGRKKLGEETVKTQIFVSETKISQHRPVWSNLNSEQILATACLLAHYRITGPVIVAGEVDPTIQAAATSKYDVAFTYNPEKNETVIT